MTVFLTSDPIGRPMGAAKGEYFPLKRDNRFVENLKTALPPLPRVLFIASDPDFYVRTDEALEMYRQAFSRSGLPLSNIAVWDHRFPDRNIQDYDLILLAGGHVPTENAFFAELGLAGLLQTYRGTVLGISAGTMNCAGTVYAQPELTGEASDPDYRRFIPGLGLTEINILPHWQMLQHETLDGLRMLEDITLPDSMGRRFLCIPDGSYVLIQNGQSVLYGQGWLAKDGTITEICRNGETLPL